ncbi:hypothetical protein LGH83_15200 [Lichenihabitans sp. PAMC28606]|uniref:hypothetical protein n=1 Tax=Lichenihabitans sp. PAMC28606 TaxID=2880932 RepID=UPI001D09E43E|nr:hypothetical protein [Lichenihabitans sp. PAMC28606]UDL93892.1 hypothetical protein LGH83_15200 [Lichenihabitans sp. PAMC28606]
MSLTNLPPAAIGLACMLVAAPAFADEMKAVPSGVNRQIDFFASVNPDCTSVGTPTVRLVDGPSRGTITTDKGRDFMVFPRSNVRHVCNRRRLSGLKLFYKSQSGFLGVDHVRVLILSASGTGREATYAIDVR